VIACGLRRYGFKPRWPAATGYRREHQDTDISILACDVPALVSHVSER